MSAQTPHRLGMIAEELRSIEHEASRLRTDPERRLEDVQALMDELVVLGMELDALREV